MLGERVKKLTKLMLTGLTMALCVVAFSPTVKTEAAMLQESEPNDNPAQANQLPLNTWLRGCSEVYQDQDWYQFTIPENGLTEIELGRTAENTNGNKWDIYLEDINRHELAAFYTNSLKYKIGLAPGKYYLKVQQSAGYGATVTYKLKVNYSKSDSWEQERYYGEKTLTNANIAYVNKQYTGKLYCNYDVDWYHFKLAGNNKLSLRFTIDDSVSDPGSWEVQFIEYNSRKILGETSYRVNANETLTIDKCSGDLIVKVSNWGASIGDIYHLQLSATPLTSYSNTTVKPSKSTTKTSTIKKPSATKITSIKAGKRKATIRWKKASKATGYYVYRATSPRGKYKKVATVTGKTSYTDKKSLKRKKNYYYKVVSIRKSGSKVVKAKASAYKRVKIK